MARVAGMSLEDPQAIELRDLAPDAFEAFDYARALERIESFFWWFCDDHVELVKARAYDTDDTTGSPSALAALRLALSALHRALAPFLPFVADEVWSWWQQGSVHMQPWPTGDDLPTSGLDGVAADAAIEPVGEVLALVRRAKTEAKLSQRAEVESLRVCGPRASLDAIEAALGDLRNAGSIRQVELVVADELTCDVTLAPAPTAP